MAMSTVSREFTNRLSSSKCSNGYEVNSHLVSSDCNSFGCIIKLYATSCAARFQGTGVADGRTYKKSKYTASVYVPIPIHSTASLSPPSLGWSLRNQCLACDPLIERLKHLPPAN